MISLRTHAISLAAVFLALAIGVALGSGLLSNTVLSGLRDDKQELQNQINGLTDEKNALNEKLSAAGEFDAQMSPRILRDTMGGQVGRDVPHTRRIRRRRRLADADGGAGRRHGDRHRRADRGVRRRQFRGETPFGGEFADRARRRAVEHQVGGPGFAGG